MKLVVLSDLHMTRPGEVLAGIDPAARLEAAIARINAAHGDADLVALAGDLTDRSRSQAYEDLRAALEQLSVPWAATLGNHDNRDVFARIFGPGALNDDGFAQSAHHLRGEVVILLDSLEKGPGAGGWGQGRGHLCARRLDWLARELDRAGGRPVHVVLHHPLLQVAPVPDPWLLEDPGPLLAMLDAYPDIRGVTAGHIHMATTTLRRGIPYHTIAGGHATSRERFGEGAGRRRFAGPGQMAVILSGAERTVLHFDDYVDANPELEA
ncbi:metallophosphoesterase [Mangrovicoccus algicola]|uniref:Metallophosphoesterase n=1 Tax=Mangrovicoccus algicola TaxID=2771008 RepID=A0A8J7CUQ6_9RHOB|nr:metallophosphoesterase [Mangrovicoccus algicola]MBE3637814.1 metallophosphoesterase [Mangrovicoccus algicola]